MSCLFCGQQIDRENQAWRIVDVTQPSVRPSWDAEVHPPHADDRDSMARLGELDGYPAHLACLRRVIADEARDDPILRQPSR